MKTLEERLRDAGERFNHETDPTGSLWVALHDVLAIVADAPRIDEKDAAFLWSLMPVWVKVDEPGLCPTMYGTCTREGDASIRERVIDILGPLPTNSPSEGKG